jgi:7-cyano-7-deazaguanine synthase
MKTNKKAIVLLSGGLDSLLTLAIAINESEQVFPLHLNYGQMTQARELKAFNDILDYYKIENKLIVDIEYLKKIGGSSLTDKNIPTVKNIVENKNIPNSYVPFRNANILAIATSWAEVISANAIYIGASEVDFSGYPDCRRFFFDAFEKAIDLGTKPDTKITIETPLINMFKEDIVNEGIRLKIPFELSWSCYFENEIACGVCESCELRLKGFKSAGIEDPIKYKQQIG